MANISRINTIENALNSAFKAEEKFAITRNINFINGKISCECHKRLTTLFSRRLLRAIALNNTLEIGVIAPRAAEECFNIASACRSHKNEILSNKDLADALENYVSAINILKEVLE